MKGRSLIFAAGVVVLWGCGARDADIAAGQSSPTAGANKINRPAIRTQPFVYACEWVPREEIEAVLGKLAGDPWLGRNAQNPEPDAQGLACVYPMRDEKGAVKKVSLQIDPDGAAAFESAMGGLHNLFARELSEDGHGEPSAPEKRTDGWDHVSGLPDMLVWRVGHLAVQVGGEMLSMPEDQLNRLAALVRDRIADVPMAMPGGDPNAAGSPPDPCALVTQQEAEAVLGKLQVAPYRSSESSSLADGTGPSCSYYSQGHRVLVLTPTYSDGEMMFEMAGGVGALLRSATGGADEGDLLEGPWDKATAGSTGSLFLLKGDKMLEVIYRTSSTDIEGATKLAQVAMQRL